MICSSLETVQHYSPSLNDAMTHQVLEKDTRRASPSHVSKANAATQILMLSLVVTVFDSGICCTAGVSVTETRHDLTTAMGQSEASPTGPSLVEMLNWEF